MDGSVGGQTGGGAQLRGGGMRAADEAAAAAASDEQDTDSDSAPDNVGGRVAAAADKVLAARDAMSKVMSRSSRNADAAATEPAYRSCIRPRSRSRDL